MKRLHARGNFFSAGDAELAAQQSRGSRDGPSGLAPLVATLVAGEQSNIVEAFGFGNFS